MTSWASPTDGSSPSAAPGMLLGDRYRLTEPLASGGMAQVWSAFDLVLDRTVAAKILHPHLATDTAFIERFRREAVAAARLHHNSIVAIYDTISAGSIEAIVMELIDGRTLRQILDEAGALTATEVARIAIAIAGALDEAHRAGIVHRDIKPANIMLASDDRVLVTDFGIAKAGSDADLTITGTLLGTAKYLAPEQVSGDPVDPRADLYALGIVMFEALAGTVPFKADTDAATALARLHQEPPSLRELRPNVPPELAAIVARLMSRDPAGRFPRASALQAALVELRSGSGSNRFQPAATGQPRPVSHPPADRAPSNPSPSPPEVPPPNQDIELLGIDDRQRAEARSSERVVRSKRSRLLPLFVVAVIAASGFGAVSYITGLGPGAMFDGMIGGESEPVSIASITSFDPQSPDAVKEEREDLTPLAADGDPATSWKTELYHQRDLGGLKDGVGLQFHLDGRQPLSSIELLTSSEDWAAEIYVGDDFGGDSENWGDPVVSIEAASHRVVRELDGAEGQIVLLWIRDTGVTANRYEFQLDEVMIR